MAKEKIDKPTAKCPAINKDASDPTIGIIPIEPTINKYITDTPTATPYFPLRDSLAFCIKTLFSVCMYYFVYWFINFLKYVEVIV